jgi:hypothetical protein
MQVFGVGGQDDERADIAADHAAGDEQGPSMESP